MCFTMIFRLKNFHSAGKVPCDGVASSIPPGKFFATASQAFCHAESSLRRRRRHSATRKVLCDGIAGILPRGKFFATASQAFCHAESSLRRHRKHSATRRETFFTLFDPQVTHFPSKTSLAGEIFSDLTLFAAVSVPMSGVKTPERGWNPVIPAMNCRAMHNTALKRRGGNLHPWNLHPRTVIYRRLCLARHFSAGSGRLPSARGFNPMHSPVVSTPGRMRIKNRG